ncbi:chemotaxis protein CheW [Undibacterium sp. TJN19]|uniref:chemotaxis protein CheW n=1 Tax=Undibacterium sp. TJN19 TaxID=3413055 RepID=UPI003BEF8575
MLTANHQEEAKHFIDFPTDFVCFGLGNEEYGIDLSKVQELHDYESVTRIDNAPGYVKGVIRLYDVTVPIIDLRIKLKLAKAIYNEMTSVIILNLSGQMLGIVVDGVFDVITFTTDQVLHMPAPDKRTRSSFMLGIGTRGKRTITLVDIEELLGSDQLYADVDLAH